jgi:hypothetical protein
MNVLLWRKEVRGRSEPGGPVPLEIVATKILTAPDDSSLEVRRHGKRIGFLRWVPNVGDEFASGKVMRDDALIEGMVRKVTGYAIDLDGTIDQANDEEGMRFHTHLELTTNRLWRQFNLRVNVRQTVYQIEADPAKEQVSLHVESGQQQINKTWGRDELSNPRALIRELGGPLAEMILRWDLLSGLGKQGEAEREVKVTWTAQHDWLTVGHARIKVYRTRVRVLDLFEAVIFVSPVGEILRVELPGEIVLINDAFL